MQQTPVQKATQDLEEYMQRHQIRGEKVATVAAMYGNLKMLTLAINNGYYVNADEAYPVAAMTGKIEAIKLLHGYGYPINDKTRENMKRQAGRHSRTDILEWLNNSKN